MSGQPDLRIWYATMNDYAFCLYLCKRFRGHEFFFVPAESLRREIDRKNIIAFDYRGLEAGYIWVTFPKSGKCRINQLAVDEQLWRNKVGTDVTAFFEQEAIKHGGWAAYLSCNSNTPGHSFWPTCGYTPIISRKAGPSRGGMNFIWAKILRHDGGLFPVTLSDIKSSDSYRLQYSIEASKKHKQSLAQLRAAQIVMELH